MTHQHYKFLSWNVRGLNNLARQEEGRQIVSTCKPDLICLQEAKLVVINDTIIRNTLGVVYVNNYVVLPANGSRGGILVAARDSAFVFNQTVFLENTMTTIVTDCKRNLNWLVTGVYVPQGQLEKKMFLRELKRLKQNTLQEWMLMGDFNLIYKG
jgi:exonuclease III